MDFKNQHPHVAIVALVAIVVITFLALNAGANLRLSGNGLEISRAAPPSSNQVPALDTP